MSGEGKGAYFVGRDWVRAAIRGAAGFDPYPSTFNVRLVDGDALARWRAIRGGDGHVLTPPSPEACGGRLIRVLVEPGITAAVIVPDLIRYGDDVLELVAPVHVRSHLGLEDGDRVTLALLVPHRVA